MFSLLLGTVHGARHSALLIYSSSSHSKSSSRADGSSSSCMRKLKKEEMVSQMTMAVWLVFLTEHSTAAYDLKSEQRLGLGRSFCGLDDQHSRTSGLQKFIPLIKATQEQQYIYAASGTSWFCQTPFGTSHGDEPQFITFYDTTNNLSVYSIYKVDNAWAHGGKRTNVL